MSKSHFGIGNYSPAEAAKLVGIPSASLRRWLFGYRYDHHGPQKDQPPLWRPEYGIDQEDPVLGFRDLIEARMVARLRRLGIGMPTIRACLETAAEIAKDDHPFSSANFRTDGKGLFLETVGEFESRQVIDLRIKQHAFARIVERSFIDLEFDEKKATHWYLLENRKSIVADPTRSFGQPLTTDYGVPTSAIAKSFNAEGSVEKVARLFDMTLSSVRDALRFETQLKAPLAA